MIESRPFRLVTIQINPDDLAYMVQKLEQLAYILNCSSEDDDPELPVGYREELLQDAARCQQLARAIALGGRVDDGG